MQKRFHKTHGRPKRPNMLRNFNPTRGRKVVTGASIWTNRDWQPIDCLLSDYSRPTTDETLIHCLELFLPFRMPSEAVTLTAPHYLLPLNQSGDTLFHHGPSSTRPHLTIDMGWRNASCSCS
ncbi:hypothetical protein TNCV_4724201 [Trichonephila clavipes]|uniref:Uncharacterized protein n=1 Tax=Trichonephila clavipes TaxID=2585209 RepID=A0A8X6W778_TRICX|nr:hypothetical protein TNCV_4724201 [Trichonephila clavipes]